MARFEVPLDTAGKPISATIAALSGRARPVSEGETKVHPYRSIPAAGGRFARALEEFLNGLKTSEAEIHFIDLDVLPQSLENLCYRAAELLEVCEKLPNVVNFRPNKSFKEIAKTYRTATDNATSDWAKLCNFVKHNSNIIMPNRYAYTPSRVVVSGFGLCKPKPGAAANDIQRDAM